MQIQSMWSATISYHILTLSLKLSNESLILIQITECGWILFDFIQMVWTYSLPLILTLLRPVFSYDLSCSNCCKFVYDHGVNLTTSCYFGDNFACTECVCRKCIFEYPSSWFFLSVCLLMEWCLAVTHCGVKSAVFRSHAVLLSFNERPLFFVSYSEFTSRCTV